MAALLAFALVSSPLCGQPSAGTPPSNAAPAKQAEPKERLLALEAELTRVRAENVRLKEDLQQMVLEVVNLKAQIRIIEKDTDRGRGPAGPVASASASARGGSSESVEELQRRIAVLRRTVELLTQENRRQAGKSAEVTPTRDEKGAPAAL